MTSKLKILVLPLSGEAGRSEAEKTSSYDQQVLPFPEGSGIPISLFDRARRFFMAKRRALRLFQSWRFDVIHAYGIYPNGVIALRLASRFRVPVIITDVSPWSQKVQDDPTLLRSAIAVSRESTFHLAPSIAVRQVIANHAGESEKLRLLPQDLENLYTEAVDRYSWRRSLLAGADPRPS